MMSISLSSLPHRLFTFPSSSCQLVLCCFLHPSHEVHDAKPGSPGLSTHYQILDVPRAASQTEIKRAYLKLLKAHHPDVQRSDEVENKQKIFSINEAYSVLSKPDLRTIYDLGLAKEEGNEKNVNKNSRSTFTRPMTFEERVAAYGYPESNPNFYKNRYTKYYIAFGCLVISIIGSAIHYLIVKMSFDKYAKSASLQSQMLLKDLDLKQQRALEINSIADEQEQSKKRAEIVYGSVKHNLFKMASNNGKN